MKHYAVAKNGEVFVRDTERDYEFAVLGSTSDLTHIKKGNHWIVSWHSRLDLAHDAMHQYARNNPGTTYYSVPVTTEPQNGPCGNCDGTGKVKCSKCRGRHEFDVFTDTIKKDEQGHLVKDEDGYLVHEQVFHHHYVCTCASDGLVKCHVCRGKGQLDC